MLADKNRLIDDKCMRSRQNFKNKKQVNDNTLISNTQATRLWSHSNLKPKAKIAECVVNTTNSTPR